MVLLESWATRNLAGCELSYPSMREVMPRDITGHKYIITSEALLWNHFLFQQVDQVSVAGTINSGQKASDPFHKFHVCLGILIFIVTYSLDAVHQDLPCGL